MMMLANYGIGSSKQKDPNSAKVLSKSLQIRNRAEQALRQCLKSHYRVTGDKRNDIMNSLTDYYSRIPFNVVIWNKYQVKQCIIDSISLLDTKFDPYKARDGFQILETMLMNLTYLPWHSEFRKIYTYSGWFQLSVCEPLIGSEMILEAAGFQRAPECRMHLKLINDKMPQIDDGESVTSVMFDCMLAQAVLSNIIEVYESNCKISKFEARVNDFNNYSWIQEYFKERSQHITEQACSNIREILNNVANNLSKMETTHHKSPGLSIKDGSEEHVFYRSNNSGNEVGESSKPSAQERTREFLAQQSQEDDNLLTLSNSLLRLPSESVRKATTANRLNETDSINTSKPTTIRTGFGESVKQHISSNNGYNSNHYHKQALFGRIPSESIETSDSVDYSNRINLPSHTPTNFRDIDVTVSDREPLLPRYDRRTEPFHSQTKRHSIYDNDFDGHDYQVKSNTNVNQLGLNRNESYFSENTSHSRQAPLNVSRGLNSSGRYNNSAYGKYESRDVDMNKSTSSRLTWACGSCTFNNSVVSEICEMCHKRRPSI